MHVCTFIITTYEPTEFYIIIALMCYVILPIDLVHDVRFFFVIKHYTTWIVLFCCAHFSLPLRWVWSWIFRSIEKKNKSVVSRCLIDFYTESRFSRAFNLDQDILTNNLQGVKLKYTNLCGKQIFRRFCV